MSAIVIERLSPERQASQPNAAAGGACCCCCCCLHSVGGLIGAAVAQPDKESSLDTEEKSGLNLSGRQPYWMSVLISCLVVFMLTLVSADGEALVGLFVLAMFGPGIQLVASLFAAFAVGNSKDGAAKPRLRHIGRMTLYSVVGAVVGGITMLMIAESV
jgi:hypothetical protein